MEQILRDICTKKLIDYVILIANVYGETPEYNVCLEKYKSELFTYEEVDSIYNALKALNYNVVVYYDETRFIKDVLNNKIDNLNHKIVFNLARNGKGIFKKSLIPTFCSLLNIKYTGSNGYGIAIARQKNHTSKLLKSFGINSAQNWLFNGKWIGDECPPPNIKVIIKLLSGAASIGVNESSICNTSDSDFMTKILEKFNFYNDSIIVEEFIDGYEVKIPIIKLSQSNIFVFNPVGLMINEKKLLGNLIISETIAAEYSTKKYDLNTIFNNEVINAMKIDAKKAFEILHLENYGRVDCRIKENGEYYFYDYSTTPYFVSNSELNFAYKQLGFSFEHILNSIINSALITKYGYSL